MKNHIAFKFLAILLCAASLLGAIGSAGGILVLTQADLYNRTVEQLIAENLENDGSSYATTLALRYASENLGGCPTELVTQKYTAYWFNTSYNPEYYGYSVTDAEGTVVASYNEELAQKTDTNVYTFHPAGQYMYLVSKTPESEKYPAVVVEENYGDVYLYDAIPANGSVAVEGFSVTYANGGSEGIGSPDGLGELFYDESGRVQFCSYDWVEVSNCGGAITHILFYDEYGEIIYEASAPDSVGFFNYSADGESTYFFSDLEPEKLGTEIYSASFYGKNRELLYELSSDSDPIGYYEIDEDGYVLFRTEMSQVNSWTEVNSLGSGFVQGITLLGASDNLVCDLTAGGENVGFVYFEQGNDFLFVSCFTVLGEEPQPAAIEAVPETTVTETVPEETAAETLPEATAAPEEFAEEEEATEEPEATEAYEEETYSEEGEHSSASAVPEEETYVSEEDAPQESEAAAEATEATEAPTVPPTTEAPAETEPMVVETVPEETIDINIESTMPVLINGKPLDEYGISTTSYYDSEAGEAMYVEYVYTPMPEYTVELYFTRGVLRYESAYTILDIVRNYRNDLFLVLGVSLLIFAVFAVYLCCAAGRKPKSAEVKAAGLNCLPLDLYLAICIGGVAGIIALGAEGTDYLLRQSIQVGCVFAAAAGFFACLLIVGFLFAFVAQVKTPGGYWWRNTLCGHFFRLFIRFGVWLEQFLSLKFFPWLGRALKKLWQATCRFVVWLFHMWEKFAQWFIKAMKRIFGWTGKKLHRFLSLLPLTWQWLLGGCAIMFLIFLIFATNGEEILIVFCLGSSIAIILYGAHCFGILSESTRRMSKGDLDTKVDDKLLIGCFKDCAADLNDLADVAVVAAQKQLKSERMKTELITNVSHDIKTPLTSIINYVDLLQKPHTDEEQAQYLEVLDRQSQRLKKLIDDLMDMSKASTGNMAVDITQLDAVESINQALGEFADKLDRAQLIPVFRHTEESVPMMADGRLVWRVLSNLLTNAVKYAMPGTRLYIDLMQLEGKVVISLKNISRDELNVEADELMERFVRGDDSRNTEGSGLGLNIAKSLMELQKGQLQLLVDGDLFKVTLIFPGA